MSKRESSLSFSGGGGGGGAAGGWGDVLFGPSLAPADMKENQLANSLLAGNINLRISITSPVAANARCRTLGRRVSGPSNQTLIFH